MRNDRNRNHRPLLLGLALALAVMPPLCALPVQADRQDVLRDALGRALDDVGDRIDINGRSIPTDRMKDFYSQRSLAPLWIGPSGFNDRAKLIVAAFRGSVRDGLAPENYILEVPALLSRSAAEMARRELLMSAALTRYALDIRNGRVAPRMVDPLRTNAKAAIDPVAVLTGAAAAPDLSVYLDHLAPSHIVYSDLRRVLWQYRQLEAAGGWPLVPDGPKLELGATDTRVAVLRQRLRVTGDLTVIDPADPNHFDAGLEAGVKAFQKRHGLEPDGVVGRQTLAALRVSAEARVHQIIVNMERWRWMPDGLGDPHILVNMAGFELDLIENDKVALKMRVVVGRPYRQTPDLSSHVTYLVLNPYWNVPRSIAVKDILPKVQDDPFYLVDQGLRVYDGWQNGVEVDPLMIDWWSLSDASFSYRLRQDPGPKNALGRIKFMFPNDHAVYLHDTPSRALFLKSVRTLSSGCIRVEEPLALAERLLNGSQGWTLAAIRRAIASGETTSVRLQKPVAVHLVYLTAWAGEEGTVQFRHDIYGRDKKLAAALFGDDP
ncbi:MAG: L,D-transpeptidase family protein [Rhodospirillales bacterium]|nr:L,D-transpeptidase family protein [Rhodospirillales bacterium]